MCRWCRTCTTIRDKNDQGYNIIFGVPTKHQLFVKFISNPNKPLGRFTCVRCTFFLSFSQIRMVRCLVLQRVATLTSQYPRQWHPRHPSLTSIPSLTRVNSLTRVYPRQGHCQQRLGQSPRRKSKLQALKFVSIWPWHTLNITNSASYHEVYCQNITNPTI